MISDNSQDDTHTPKLRTPGPVQYGPHVPIFSHFLPPSPSPPHISSLQLGNCRAKAIPEYVVQFWAFAHAVPATYNAPLFVSTWHNPPFLPSSSLAPPGNCFNYNLCIWELHSNSHCSTFHTGLYSLLIGQSLPSEWEMWARDTHLGLKHFIIPSVKHILRNSTNIHMTRWWSSIWEVLWVICFTGFRKEG